MKQLSSFFKYSSIFTLFNYQRHLLIRTQWQSTKLLPLIISRTCLYEKSYECACGLIASTLLFLSLSHFSSCFLPSHLSVYRSRLPLLVCEFLPFTLRYPVFIHASFFPSFPFISVTSHSLARFVSPTLVVPSPVCFPAFYLALASSLSSLHLPPPFFRDLRRNIFPRNVRVHLLRVTSVRSIGRVPTHEIRIWLLHTFAICEIAFAAVHTRRLTMIICVALDTRASKRRRNKLCRWGIV